MTLSKTIAAAALALATAIPAQAGTLTIQTPGQLHTINGSWDMQTLQGHGSFYMFATGVSSVAAPSSSRPAGYKNFHGQVTQNGGSTNVGFGACVLTESDDGGSSPFADFWCGTQSGSF